MAKSTRTNPIEDSDLIGNNPEIAHEIQIVRRSLARKDPEHERFVESLKRQIEDGTYEPDSMDIASALIAERLSERASGKS